MRLHVTGDSRDDGFLPRFSGGGDNSRAMLGCSCVHPPRLAMLADPPLPGEGGAEFNRPQMRYRLEFAGVGPPALNQPRSGWPR